MKQIPIILAALLCGLLTGTAAAQTAAPAPADTVWNGIRALELIQRAQERRTAATADTGLVNYQADARLYVYFYLDRTDTGSRNLVKTDQLALDVLWAAPDRVKQRIIGWRNQKSLPTNINYHLDHLTVVQENFGDEIRLGDGDEVRGVPHPAAAGASTFYDYRLADSLTLRLPGVEEPVRVYELRVRPRDPTRPAFLGSVFVDRRAGDIVRMDFTFTRAAYVDRYLDYINISLDNGLWRGRFWLPNEQRMEIRRRVPLLDFPVGSIIRGTMRVGNYRFNQPLPPGTFAGAPVVTVPRAQRESFAFEQDIHAEVREEGIGPEAELTEVRRLAAELVRRQALQRVAALRLSIPRVSEVLRYNRAEGLALGAGVSLAPRPGLGLGVRAGWALGAAHPFGSLTLGTRAGETDLTLAAYGNRTRDIGGGPVVSGAVNTVSALVAGQDYTDPYYVSGVELRATRPLAPFWELGWGLRAERQRSASAEGSFALFGGDFRPVRRIDRASPLLGARLEARRTPPAEVRGWWSGSLAAEVGTTNPGRTCYADDGPCPLAALFARPEASLGWGRRWSPGAAELAVDGAAGVALGRVPLQEHFLIGGRGTVPGYAFRAYGGDRFALARLTLSRDLVRPWIRARALGAVGWAGGGEREELAAWPALPTGGAKSSVGLGLGLFHDIIRLDVARGLASGGRWEVVLEANPSFWDFL